MDGAVFYSGQYGSTAQYADWIAAETGLVTHDIRRSSATPADYDFVVLGSSVIAYRLTIQKWVNRHVETLMQRPVIFFSVAGAPPGDKVTEWVRASMPEALAAHMQVFALRGRMDPKAVSLWHRIILRIGAMMNSDPQSRKDELEGFDYMDQASISPVVEAIRALDGGR